jgi:hypothetical protein
MTVEASVKLAIQGPKSDLSLKQENLCYFLLDEKRTRSESFLKSLFSSIGFNFVRIHVLFDFQMKLIIGK